MVTKLYRTFKTKRKATGPCAPHGCTVSRATWLRLGSVFGPLLLLVVLMRLLQYSITVRAGVPPLSLILTSAALTPLLLFLASVAAYVGCRARWPAVLPVWHFFAVSAASVGLMIGTSLFVPPPTTEWLTFSAFEAIRWDVLLLLLLALSFLFLLERTRGPLRLFSLVILYVLMPPLMFLPAGTFGYFVSTGSPADVTLLKYFLFNFSDVSQIIAPELHGLRMLLLCLPVLVLLPPLLLLRIGPVRRWAYAAPAPPEAGMPWQVLLGTVPFVLLLALLPQTSLPAAYPPSSYVSILGADAVIGSPHMRPVSQENTPPFDTRGLHLSATDSTRRMNVVMIFLESVRARSTTLYNPSLDTTPFLDSLARRGLVAEQMYAVVPYTNKSLTPLLAGIPPYPHREILEARPGGIPGPGLPTLLKPHGYRSAFFSPATLHYERKDLILKNLGFEETYGDGAFEADGFYRTNNFGSEDQVVIEPSLAWVDARVAAGEPFFLSYLTLVSHYPYAVPPSFPQRDYGVEDKSLNAYLNAVHYADDFLRRLIQGFEERGLIDSTLFIIVGDHGQAFGEHKQRMHPDVLWDEALHVPALLYNPVLFPRQQWAAGPRQQVDFLPTVADVLNMKLEGGFYPGLSMLRPVPPGRTLYFSGWESDIVLAQRQGAMKFMCRYKRCAMQAFDTAADPLEQNNLAPTLPPERLREAEREMRRWRNNVQQVYQEQQRQIAH